VTACLLIVWLEKASSTKFTVTRYAHHYPVCLHYLPTLNLLNLTRVIFVGWIQIILRTQEVQVRHHSLNRWKLFILMMMRGFIQSWLKGGIWYKLRGMMT
jgi:hypothetical protein